MLFGVNCYVVYDPLKKEAAIVDPGIVDKSETEEIEAFLRENGLKVVAIVNTHLHIDHAIANSDLAERYGVPVMAHAADSFLGSRMKEQAVSFGLPFKVEGAGVTHNLADGDRIKIGDGELEVIHVPGHSPGGIALYDSKDGFLISGDSLFEGSIGRTDLPGGDMDVLLEAIRNRLYILPDSTVVYPGHGPATSVGKEKISNPFTRAGFRGF